MKVLVCGGRDFTFQDFVDSFMDGLVDAEPISLVIHGGAKGADACAEKWAVSRGIHTAVVNAQWSRGRAAGPLRNEAMLMLNPDMVVAFPGGAGTSSMMRLAKRAGIHVMEA